jgi:preprotein translocase subunit SecE
MFKRLKAYLVESYYELKKVNWPTRSETVNLTIIVIAISLFVAAFLGVLDILFSYILEHLII